jgi:IS30 family transposase
MGTDLSKVSYQQLSAYQEMLNERPRKILGWKSPAQCFHELIVSTRSSNRFLNAPQSITT